MSRDKKKGALQAEVLEKTGGNSLCPHCKKKCKDSLSVSFCNAFSLNKDKAML